ncbi:MAG TPA: D,D-heptose 1,7-bisphosphate phosphatase [Cytophagales bacterium]|jgi:D-glycero-D-manno-heptose 1,7-bisphosphate phosphatase|nr:D,D-heptose 1,7-bisphosphate phosphatase [Cytophagales bacterium]
MNACVFLDRDGVINEDNPNYTYRVSEFKIMDGVISSLQQLKLRGFLLVVVTNQSGIAQGIYTREQMEECHRFFQEQSGHLIDHFYFSPDHPSVSASLSRKPNSLMFEKAIAKFKIDVTQSWMIGDKGRDIVPARKLGIKTIQIGNEIDKNEMADYAVGNLAQATKIILG